MKKLLLFVAFLALASCNNDDAPNKLTLTDLNGTWKEVSRHSLDRTYKVDCDFGDPQLFVFYENDTYRLFDACAYNPENWQDYIEEGGTDLLYNRYLTVIDGQIVHMYDISRVGKNKIKFRNTYDNQLGEQQGIYSVFERVGN